MKLRLVHSVKMHVDGFNQKNITNALTHSYKEILLEGIELISTFSQDFRCVTDFDKSVLSAFYRLHCIAVDFANIDH